MTAKTTKAKGEIVIREGECEGCGYCVEFCPTRAIMRSKDNFTFMGYLKPVFAYPEKCTACLVCYWMCPHNAIEVYKYDRVV